MYPHGMALVPNMIADWSDTSVRNDSAEYSSRADLWPFGQLEPRVNRRAPDV